MQTDTRITKEQIKAIAAKMIGQKGFLGFTLDTLAQTLNTSKDAISAYYTNEEDLLWDIALDCGNAFFRRIKPIYEAPNPPKRKLELMMIEHVKVLIENINAAAIFLHEWRHLSKERKEEYIALRDAYEKLFRDVIEQGIQDTVFRGPDAKMNTLMVLSALNWTYQWYRPDGIMSADEVASLLADMLLNGLVRRI